MKIYNSYVFKDKDPVIYEVRDAIERAGVSHNEIERRSGVTSNTLFQWFHGKTQRPQHATVRAVLRAIGYDYRLVEISHGGKVVNIGHNHVAKGRGRRA